MRDIFQVYLFFIYDVNSIGLIDGSMDFQWLHQLPIVNVDIRWANSIGGITKVQVDGQIDGTLNGPIHFSRTPGILNIQSQLNPT